MKALALAVLATIIFLLSLTPRLAEAAGGECQEQADLGHAKTTCHRSADEVRDLYRQGPSSGYTYKLEQRFLSEQSSDDRYRPIPCTDPPNTFSFALYRSPVEANPPAWEYYGTVCLGSPEEVTQQITVAMVEREFRRLTWPAARLTIQPPDGETMVNLPTIFYTPDRGPLTQTVTLLGQTVQIEAQPVQWTWHWAQPRDQAHATSHQPHTTTHPGAPHPAATITHAYRLADTTVHPSLDVTYRGRFRVGNGPWTDIPATHTVAGTPQSLAVLEARPTLVQ